MSTDSSNLSVRPMLATYAQPRTGDPTIEGYFSSDLDVWVVDGEDGPFPIILLRDDIGQTSTITRVRAEQDDSDERLAAMVSTSTFTKVVVEGNDTDLSCAALLEVTTKTHAQLESDDHRAEIDAYASSDGNDGINWAVPVQ